MNIYQRFLKYFFAFILLFNCFNIAQQKIPNITNTYSINDFNNLALESLKSKKITMIGDGMHGHGYFKKQVIGLLNNWIECLEKSSKNESIPQKIFLFLECDSVHLRLMNRFIDSCELHKYLTHQIDELFQFGAWEQYSIDNFEFLFDLRELKSRIIKLNNKNGNQEIELRIKGAENPPPFTFSAAFHLGPERYRSELFSWFAKERDEAVSKNIIRTLEDNKDFSAVIFYGTGHFLRGFVDKSPYAYSEKQEPVYGYYLAHYLDEYFGRKQIDIYYTVKVHGSNTNLIKEYEKDDQYYDYYILCDVLPDFPFSIYMLNNHLLLKTILNLSDKYVEGTAKEEYLLFINSARTFYNHLKRSYLYFDKYYKEKIDSLSFYPLNSKSKDIRYIYKTTRRISMELIDAFDIVENIKNMDKWILMNDEFGDRLLFERLLKRIAFNLPINIAAESFYNSLGNSLRTDTLEFFEINQIKNRMEELKIYYAVTSMWVNSTVENENIQKYLQQKTGLNYITVKEWNDWWRKKYTNTY